MNGCARGEGSLKVSGPAPEIPTVPRPVKTSAPSVVGCVMLVCIAPFEEKNALSLGACGTPAVQFAESCQSADGALVFQLELTAHAARHERSTIAAAANRCGTIKERSRC